MVRGSLITLAFQVVALILGFASRSILAAMLHDDGLGFFEIFRFIPTFLHAVSNLGLNNAIVNFIGRKKRGVEDLAAMSISGGILISVITLALSAIVFAAIRFAFWGHDLIHLPNIYILLAVLIYIPYMLWFLNVSVHLGRNRMLAYNIVWVMHPVVMFIGFVLMRLFVPEDAALSVKTGYAYLSFCAGIIISLIVGLVILGRDRLLGWSYSKGTLKESIRFGIQTHIGSLVGFLGLKVNVVFLMAMMSVKDVGIYSIPMMFGEAFKRLFSSISTALLPIASSAEGEKGRGLINVVMRTTIFICIVTLGAFALIARPIIFLLFDEIEFAGAYTPTLVILIWVFFTSLNKVFQSDAIGRGKPIWVTYSMLVTLTVLFVASWILVPLKGIMGAAWASTYSSIAGFLLWLGLYITKAEGFSLLHAIVIKPNDFSKIFRKLFQRGNDEVM